jgi:hypothetical protein
MTDLDPSDPIANFLDTNTTDFKQTFPLPRKLWTIPCQLIHHAATTIELEAPLYAPSKIPPKEPFTYKDSKFEFTINTTLNTPGLPTIFDQDVIIYVTSVILAERNQLKKYPHSRASARTDPKREGTIFFSTADYCEFTKRTYIDPKTGRKRYPNYRRVKHQLDRLGQTFLSFSVDDPKIKRTQGTASLLSMHDIQRHNEDQDTLTSCRLTLTPWLIDAIDANQVVRLDDRYFHLIRPFDRAIYQLYKRHAGDKRRQPLTLDMLYHKGGFRSPFARFKHMMGQFHARHHGRFIDYAHAYNPKRNEVVVHFLPPDLEAIARSNLKRCINNGMANLLRSQLVKQFPDLDPDRVFQKFLYSTSMYRHHIRKEPNAELKFFMHYVNHFLPKDPAYQQYFRTSMPPPWPPNQNLFQEAEFTDEQLAARRQIEDIMKR